MPRRCAIPVNRETEPGEASAANAAIEGRVRRLRASRRRTPMVRRSFDLQVNLFGAQPLPSIRGRQDRLRRLNADRRPTGDADNPRDHRGREERHRIGQVRSMVHFFARHDSARRTYQRLAVVSSTSTPAGATWRQSSRWGAEGPWFQCTAPSGRCRTRRPSSKSPGHESATRLTRRWDGARQPLHGREP